MYAVDDLGDAIDVTREFLTPVDAQHWFKLAIVVVFLSGLSFTPPSAPSGNPFSAPVTDSPPGDAMMVDQPLPTENVVELAIVAASIGLVAWLVFGVLGSLLEFVLIDALRSGSVTIRAGLRRHVRKGLSLFAFRTVIGVLALASIAIPAFLALRPIDSIESIEGVSMSTVGGLLGLVILVVLAYGIVIRLTTEFVVPVMLFEDRGIRGGWGRFWRTLRRNVGEYAAYVVLVTIVDIVAAIAIGLVSTVVLFIVAIPFVLLGLVALLLGPLAIPLLVVIASAAVITFLLVTAMIRMPVVVYVRYYALLVLGDTDSDLDLIPDRRDGVRSGADWDGGDGRAGRSDDWAGPDDAGSTDDSSGSGWDGSDDTGSSGTESGGWSESGDDEDDSDWGYRDDR